MKNKVKTPELRSTNSYIVIFPGRRCKLTVMGVFGFSRSSSNATSISIMFLLGRAILIGALENK